MADETVINRAELDFLLYAPAGEVMQELHKLGKQVERGAKRRAPAAVRDGVNAKAPAVDADGPHVDIYTEAETADGTPIGLFAEVGTAPHVIESRGNYPLRSKDGRVFGKKVNHPGTKAQPHLRPALHEDID